LPHPTFFRYCSELLNRYRSDARVMEISGNNAFHTENLDDTYSYSFSTFTHTVAWASWKRAWKLFDHQMNLYGLIRKEVQLKYNSLFEQDYYSWVFERTYLFPNESWRYQWEFAKKINTGLTIVPQRNLVALLEDEEANLETPDGPLHKCEPLEFPLVHPPNVMANRAQDSLLSKNKKRQSIPE
jgi:hypothetical protein